ncbi:hypothetical protein Vafri_9513 [Volvox africanus]|uniref:Phospholipid/glycerol acyltransferase domain-containing protein n=1 Tax=Volvox africanus TaxID=51714 RepID=A0A8J4B526_9CHLO|nr:hypothetical protein Vafri_9513 [Volvox africanus]
MSLLRCAKLMRPRASMVGPYARRCGGRLSRFKTHVLNKERQLLSEEIASSADLSEDEPPTPSSSGLNAAGILFDEDHVRVWSPELVLYTPLGFLLAAFRSALWILGIALDQPWFRNQSIVGTYMRLLGVTVIWRHAERIPIGRHVMVSNHCSVGDLMMLFSHPSLPQRYTHLITSALPAQVTRARHLPVIMRPASPATYDELASTLDPSPVHLFPEGGMTNGRGMLRFSRGFMRILQQQQQQQNLCHVQQEHVEQLPASQQGGISSAVAATVATLPVVPVALRVNSSLSGVKTHTLNSSFLANLFWFGFSPRTTLEATVLPPMFPAPGEARGAFVVRVQAAIAKELDVEVYEMTIQQKRMLAGRKRA